MFNFLKRKEKSKIQNIDIEDFIKYVLDIESIKIPIDVILKEMNENKKQQIYRLIDEIVNQKEKEDKEIQNKIKGIVFLLNNEYKRIRKVKELDYTDIRNDIIEHIGIDTKKYNFYYDETNYFGKVYLRTDGTYNVPLEKYFVLGGVCIKLGNIYNFQKLEEKLHFNEKLEEIKSFDFFSSCNFIEAMEQQQLNILLQWILDNDIYIHFEAVDNFFIIVSDILDLICDDEKYKIIYSSTLMKLINKDKQDFINILKKHKYPSIDDFDSFLIDFEKYIKKQKSISSDKMQVFQDKIFLTPLAEQVSKKRKEGLLYREKNNIIDSYLVYYEIMPMIFLNSMHTFDIQQEIQKKQKKLGKITINNEKLNNYKFVDSKSEKMVQISDVLVSLLSKLLLFIDEYEIGDKTLESLVNLRVKLDSTIKRNNFVLLMRILKKSVKENNQFIRINKSFIDNNKFNLFIDIEDITEKGIQIKN